MSSRRFAIIVAGGSGTRAGSPMPKQFMPLGGKPMLAHSLEAFHAWDKDITIIIALPESFIEVWHRLCEEAHVQVPHLVVPGGKERFHSVQNALSAIDAGEGLVAVHDAARPFLNADLIDCLFSLAEKEGSAIPVVPLRDSIRVIDEGRLKAADRSLYRAVQTPQVFSLAGLKAAYRHPYIPQYTDDASVYELDGHVLSFAEGDDLNLKITTPADLEYARYMLDNKPIS